MKIWKWKAIDEKGNIHKGIFEDRLESDVLSHLLRQKLYPVHIKRSFIGAIAVSINRYNSKLYWARTTRKISTLLEAGIPLLSVIDIIMDKESNPHRRNQWLRVSDNIQSGKELSLSLNHLSPSPGHFFNAMVVSGEKSGTLQECFLNIAEQMEEEYFFEQKIKTALFYPVLLLVVSLIILYTLSVVVIPMYETLFISLNAELPLITKALFSAGSFIPYFMIGAAIFIFGAYTRRHENPISFLGTKKIMRCRAVMQFCVVLERLLNAGITLRECLSILEKITKDKDSRQLVAQINIAVEEGKRISGVIMTNGFFPLEAAKMIEVAEESGKMSEMLNHIGKMYKKELEERLQKQAKVLEPVLIMGMSFVVGLIAIGVLLPIFDLSMHIS